MCLFCIVSMNALCLVDALGVHTDTLAESVNVAFMSTVQAHSSQPAPSRPLVHFSLVFASPRNALSVFVTTYFSLLFALH